MYTVSKSQHRHLEFLILYDDIDMFQIEVPMCPQILLTIGQIVKKWQQFFEIQDGGGHLLECF